MLLARKFYERVYNRWIQPRSLPIWSPLNFPCRCVFPLLQRQHFHGRGADAAGRDLILLLRQHRHHPALCCSLEDDPDRAAGKVAMTTTALPALVSSACATVPVCAAKSALAGPDSHDWYSDSTADLCRIDRRVRAEEGDLE